MDKKRFIDKVINALKMSLTTDFKDLLGSCNAYDFDDFNNYWDDSLTKKESRIMESHCLDCPICIHLMARAWDIHDKTKNISRKINYDTFSDLAAKLIDNSPMTKSRIKLWAAASDRTGGQGEALGVAVAEDSEEGILVECNAWVGNEENRPGKLQLWGMQVEGTESGLHITRPLDYLEDKLEGIFLVNPLLRMFNLNQRYINVDLKEKVLQEANSLSLAVVMSIVNAVLQRKETSPLVYSADIRQDGKLEKVGQIRQKLEIAKKFRIKEVVLSKENLPDIPTEFSGTKDIKIHFFDNLLELFKFFNVFSSDEDKDLEISEDSEKCTLSIGSTVIDKPVIKVLSAGVKEWDFIFKKIKDAEIEKSQIERLLPFFEDLCHTRYVKGQFSTVFFMGMPEKIHTVLSPSGFELLKKQHLLETTENLQGLAALVDGTEMGFVLDSNGSLDSICKVNVGIVGRHNVSPFLMGANYRYACLSLLTESIVFFFPQTGRHLNIFFKGNLIGKYLNGRWIETNYDFMEKLLRKTSESSDLSWATLKKAAKSAVFMAERGLGGTFFFLKETEKITDNWEDRLEAYLGIYLKPLFFDELTEEELIILAKEEGAVIIDRRGRIITCCAFFLSPIERRPGLNARHQYACKFSKITGGLAIVASRYGTVTLYSNGNELICI